jgi:hypothetical protein
MTMNRYSCKIGITNSRERPHVVAVEPWAEDFTLLPGEELEVVTFGDTTVPWFQVVEWDGTSQVYCENTVDFKVLQNGVVLKCGHSRQLSDG